MKMKYSEICKLGLDFFEFLNETDRAEIKYRSQLKEIYNLEFRDLEGRRGPNFWKVLHVLELSCKIEIYSTKRKPAVRFTPEVTAIYEDQWHSRRSQQRLAPRNGSSGQTTQSTDVGEEKTGVQARRPRTQNKFASYLLNKLNTNMAEFISDKHGIVITSDHDLENGKILGVEGVVCYGGVYQHVVHLYVENTGTEPVRFTYYSPLQWLKCFSLEDERRVTRANPLKLKPGESYKIKVIFRTNLVGYYPATFAFEFKPDLPSSTAFHIVRIIEAKCVTSFGKELGPEAPYKPCVIPAIKYLNQSTSNIVDGLPPENLSVLRLKMEVGLKKYEVPKYMTQLVMSLKNPNSVRDARKSLLQSQLNEENYCKKFQLMLFLEEIQSMYDIRRYDIPKEDGEHASMVRDTVNKRLLILEVEGVSENRPSVLRGDQLLVRPKGEEKVKYRGYVHSVELDQVKLGFSSQLVDRFIDDMKFSVEFMVNRLMMRVQHRALEFVAEYRLGKVLFPNTAISLDQQQLQLPTLRLFDRNLEKNPEQYAAVQHIVAGSSKPAPYLLFGPPGTGKTVTMVEAIKQIEKTQGSCHILACAPSNSASDLLCKKIIEHVDPHTVFRMYASSLEPKRVPAGLLGCSNLEGDTYVYPLKEELMKYKIIVTTLITAGRLVTGGIPPGHFTHVFVDEAGHAVETECLIPLAGLLHAESGQVVLAGDHKQLGPILRSPLSIKYGMDVSLLERLMRDFPLYQKEEEKFNNRFVTKLLKNYRSHPAILKIPNEMFYDGELQACADEMLRESYCGWEYLPKKNFPVIFHGVTGIDEREKSSPSFFNVAEVEVLMDYLRKLFETQGKKGRATISPHEIGIIAPYRKQGQKIRKGLQKLAKDLRHVKNMDHLKVGSVEEFQGQERRVILVSAVRSSRRYAEFDQQFSLGFVKNEKRFNVALTRAKALLIVVGNPIVLRSDPTWERFLQYCRDEGGYTGVSDTEDDKQVETRLVQLFAQLEVTVETAESVVQQQLEPEWRHDM